MFDVGVNDIYCFVLICAENFCLLRDIGVNGGWGTEANL